MNLCEDGHEEVCYEVKICPMCIIINDTDAEIKDLKIQIGNLQNSLDEERGYLNHG